jgi:hypothetical protein
LALLRLLSALARWSGLRCNRDPRDREDGFVYQDGAVLALAISAGLTAIYALIYWAAAREF